MNLSSKDIIEKELNYVTDAITLVSEHSAMMLKSELAVELFSLFLTLKKIDVHLSHYKEWIVKYIFDGKIPNFLDLSAKLDYALNLLDNSLSYNMSSPCMEYNDTDEVDEVLSNEINNFRINKLSSNKGVYEISQNSLLYIKYVVDDIKEHGNNIDSHIRELCNALKDFDEGKTQPVDVLWHASHYYENKYGEDDERVCIREFQTELGDGKEYDQAKKKLTDYIMIRFLFRNNKPLLAKQDDIAHYLIENRENVRQDDIRDYFKYNKRMKLLQDRIERFHLNERQPENIFINNAAEEFVKKLLNSVRLNIDLKCKYHAASLLMAIGDLKLIPNSENVNKPWRKLMNEMEMFDENIADNTTITKSTGKLLGKRFCNLSLGNYKGTNMDDDEFSKHAAVYKTCVNVLNSYLKYDLVNELGFNECWVDEGYYSEKLPNDEERLKLLVSVIKGEKPMF